MKEVRFRGNSKAVIHSFPAEARNDAGHQLYLVQKGDDPDDWKPMSTIGRGVREIRVRDASGAFRVVYVASLGEYVYVLHAFQKKTQKTSLLDIQLASARYKALLKEIET